MKTEKYRWGKAYSNKFRSFHTSKIVEKYKPRSVLDIGAGAMELKKYLPKKIKYTPADLHKRAKNTIVLDLNKKQFPKKNMIVLLQLE